jgi:hypothetical protein
MRPAESQIFSMFLNGATGDGSGLLGSLASLFGGHRATGGDVQAGQTYEVGEMGREYFTPTQHGRITPNSKTGGGGVMYYVDARGSDSAAMNANMARMLAAVHGKAVEDASTVQREAALRRPRGAF